MANVRQYVRGIANPFLARFGYNYDSWMAAFGPGGSTAEKTFALLVAPTIKEHLAKMVSRRR